MTSTDGRALDDFLWTPRHSPWRWPLAAATAVTAAAHLPVIGPHLREAPYMGEEFIVLTAACLLLGLAAVVCDSRAVYSLTVVVCGFALAAYAATRLIAFPQLAGDVGNWLEPLGVVSVLAEAAAVIIAIRGLAFSPARGSRRQPRTRASAYLHTWLTTVW